MLNYGNLTEIKIIKYLSVENIEKIKDIFFYEKDRMNKLKHRKSVMRYTWSKKRSKKVEQMSKKMLFAPELSVLKNALCSEQKSGARAKKICSRAKKWSRSKKNLLKSKIAELEQKSGASTTLVECI